MLNCLEKSNEVMADPRVKNLQLKMLSNKMRLTDAISGCYSIKKTLQIWSYVMSDNGIMILNGYTCLIIVLSLKY